MTPAINLIVIPTLYVSSRSGDRTLACKLLYASLPLPLPFSYSYSYNITMSVNGLININSELNYFNAVCSVAE